MFHHRAVGLLVVLLLLTHVSSVSAAEPWKRHIIDDTSRGADGARLQDVNGDGLPDIATGWEEGGVIRAYLNPGPAQADEPWPRVTVGKVRSSEDAVFADLDGDGASDVVSSCEGGNRTMYVHWAPAERDRYLQDKAWSTEPIPATQKKQAWMFALPLNVDGRHGLDLIVSSKGGNASIGWLQSPAEPRDLSAWKYRRLYDAGWIMSLVARDIDDDGDRDVIASDRKGNNRGVLWLENPGPETAGCGKKWPVHRIGGDGREIMFLDVTDFDGDGQTDVLAAVKPHTILFLRQKNDPRDRWETHTIDFPQTVDGLPTGTAKSVRAADVDGDDRTDLLVTCENAHGEKTGAFWMSYREAVTDRTWDAHPIGGSPGLKYDLIQVVDVNDDGAPDLLTCEERDFNAVLWYENPFGDGEE